MEFLSFGVFLNVVILLVIYFALIKSESSKKTLFLFGIFIGSSALFFMLVFGSCFGASTPIDVKTKNLTQENLKIYAIAFWEDCGNGGGNYVYYDKELSPNQTSTFCIDNDGGKFWLIAKNHQSEIVFLKESTNLENDFNFKIEPNQAIEIEKSQYAAALTFKSDKSEDLKQYIIWANIILIVLLALNYFKK